MKKMITRCMVMALGMLSFMACHEDKGNYDYRELVDFYVDQQDIPLDFTITQFHTLNLPSRLVYGGNKNNLEYAWAVVIREIRAGAETRLDTLATTEDLAAPVPTAPGTYTLLFTATERESKRSTFQLYNLTVEGAIGTGLLVLHEKNGVVDCDLIKTSRLVGSLQRDTVLHALYSQANPGYSLAGKPLQVSMVNPLVAVIPSYLYLWTDADGVRLSPVDMSITHRFEELFFIPPRIVKPQGHDLDDTRLVETLINDGKYHTLSIIHIAFGQEKEALFTATVPGDYHAAPYIAQATYLSPLLLYDQTGMRFTISGTLPVASTVPGNAFDLDNIGKKMVYMETGFGSVRKLAIFKNPVEDGSRYLYLMNINTYSAASLVAEAAYDISAWPDIANAGLFTFSTRGPVGFYATGTRVYRYTYDPNDFSAQPTAQEAWPYIPAGETITALQITKHAGISVPESALGKYLLIATYNEGSGEGKVYMIEVDVVNGTCVATPTAVYTGFGKVASITFKPV
jgi:hypothetical protein